MRSTNPETLKVRSYLAGLSAERVRGLTLSRYIGRTKHKVKQAQFGNEKVRRLKELEHSPRPKRAQAIAEVIYRREPTKYRTIQVLASVPLESFTPPYAELKIFANAIAKQIGKEDSKEWEAVLFADPPTLEIRAFV